jgi:hypothetical protein
MTAVALAALSKIVQGRPQRGSTDPEPRRPSTVNALAALRLRLAGAARPPVDEPPPTTEKVPSSPRPSSRAAPEVRVEQVAIVPLTPEEEAALRAYQRDGQGSKELRAEADKVRRAFEREQDKFILRSASALQHQLYAEQARNEILVHARMADDPRAEEHQRQAEEARRSAENARDNMRLFGRDLQDLLARAGLLEGAQEKTSWNKATEAQRAARRTKATPHAATWQVDASLLADVAASVAGAEARMTEGPTPQELAQAEATVIEKSGRPILRRGWVVIAMAEGSGHRMLTDVAADFVDGNVRLDRRWGASDIVAGPFRERAEAGEQLQRLGKRNLSTKELVDLAGALAVPRVT